MEELLKSFEKPFFLPGAINLPIKTKEFFIIKNIINRVVCINNF